ncbi:MULTISPECIES: hypothetical protein [Massilia]|uniref:Uncharacterized protein n=1 Tax=Massilia haematophila TaxID=457923 RepID=A0ABV7PE66_9BURK|nr:hypothetical protein [Massilia sp.]
MNTEQKSQPIKHSAEATSRRPRRRIARQLVERGQRLRNRAGVLVGVALGLLALVSALE